MTRQKFFFQTFLIIVGLFLLMALMVHQAYAQEQDPASPSSPPATLDQARQAYTDVAEEIDDVENKADLNQSDIYALELMAKSVNAVREQLENDVPEREAQAALDALSDSDVEKVLKGYHVPTPDELFYRKLAAFKDSVASAK